jgi:hypothetical protein
MKTRILLVSGISVLVTSLLHAQKSTSDLQPPQRRQATVEIAERLSRPPTPAPIPDDLPQPFNPAGFDTAEGGSAPAAGQKAVVAGPPAQPAGPVGDREILETLAARLPAASSANFKGKPILIMGTKRLEVGTTFILSYNNQDYELELVAIGNTTFTLRYRSEELTRPNRPTR